MYQNNVPDTAGLSFIGQREHCIAQLCDALHVLLMISGADRCNAFKGPGDNCTAKLNSGCGAQLGPVQPLELRKPVKIERKRTLDMMHA